MRESALGDCVGVKFHVLDFALHFVAAHVHDGISVVLNLDNIIIVKINDFLRVVDDGRDIACEVEVSFVSDTKNERTSTAGSDQYIRFFAANDSKSECAFNLLERLENCGLQIAVIIAGNEVRYDFGVGLGLEFDALGDELCLEACVVLDDAVMNN